MKRALPILLLTLTLWGAESRVHVPAAALEVGARLNLYSYARLGVEVQAFSDEDYAAYRATLHPAPAPCSGTIRKVPGEAAHLREKMGLRITRVLPDSPAERAGIEAGDVMVHIGGACMQAPTDLLKVLRNAAPGCPLHMMLIGRDRRWKNAMPKPQELSTPAHVGYIVPRVMDADSRCRMKEHQQRAIALLASKPVPIQEACEELEAICRILCRDYTPGSLRIPLRSGDCSITATRFGWNIEVRMEEGGKVTTGTVRRWVWEACEHNVPPSHPGPNVLPESIRLRLLEMVAEQPLPYLDNQQRNGVE